MNAAPLNTVTDVVGSREWFGYSLLSCSISCPWYADKGDTNVKGALDPGRVQTTVLRYSSSSLPTIFH